MSKPATSTEATLVKTRRNEWSLPEYLLYHQKCTDFSQTNIKNTLGTLETSQIY
ncbi:8282_t:CDS:2 [Rhizophagus irregularis]|nr:8282_t:CDS:2 [Rhizophagus irregularis]